MGLRFPVPTPGLLSRCRCCCAVAQLRSVRWPARFVFATRHGEFSRTLSLLRTLAADEPVSPADFSLSVHNALAGLLSIASKNQEGHTSLAAAGDTFACGLLEAAATLAASPKQPVLLVYYDEPLPPPYDTFGAAGDGTMALALLLGAPGGEGVIELDADPDETVEAPSGVQQALGFLRFYLSGAETGTSPGSGRLWHWRRAAH
jgi:hypothetical protein